MMNRARLLRMNPPCGETRREFLWEAGGGFAGMALTSMLSADGFFGATRADDSLRPKASHQARPTKACICLFMYGGPSHMDTFDYKPDLYPLDGKTIDVKTFGRGGKKKGGRVVGPKWKFKK